jgi:DNA-binding CsgD family transcriptional regulator
MLERDDELAALETCLTESAAGAGRMVIVDGPAGIGKSRLLAESVQVAERRGFTVLRARGSELESPFAFGVVRQLFEPVVARASAPERERLLAGAAVLCEPLFGAAPDPADAELGLRRLHGLYWLCANLCEERPLLLALDDLQWADASSLRFIAYLAARLDGIPVAVVAGARMEEAGMSAGLLERTGAATVSLRPLSPHGVGALARHVLGHAPVAGVVTRCHEATGGIPFLALALLRAGERRGAEEIAGVGPETIARWVERRLERLPTSAAAFSRAVAILGGHAELRHAAALAGLDAATALADLDALCAARILEAGTVVRFVHPIVQTAVYAFLPGAERDAGHLAAARLLEADGRPVHEVAAHLMRVEPRGDAWIARTVVAAADDAGARGAPDETAALLRRALREPPPPDLRVEARLALGIAEIRLADPGGIERLIAVVDELEDPRRRAAAVGELMLGLFVSGRIAESSAILERAIEAVAPRDREAALALESVLGAANKHIPGRPPLASRWVRYGAITGATTGERMLLGEIAWQRAMAGAPASEVGDVAERAIADGAATLLGQGAQPQFFQAAWLIATCDRYERAELALLESLAAGHQSGSPALTLLAEHWLAHLALWRGRIRDAESHATTACDLGSGIGWDTAASRALLALVLAERGQLEAAETALDLPGAADELPVGVIWSQALEGRAALRLAQGRAEEALADLVAVRERERGDRGENPSACPWRSLSALALQSLGEDAEAERLARDEVALARAFGAPRALGVALRTLGLVTGDPDHLREAVGVLAPSGARLEHARALVDLGAAVRRAGRRAEARVPLREGLELATACGGTALVVRARAELLAAGARPRRNAFHGIDSLTASERRVAELAADGLGNVAIAQALFVSRKTVETHLGHVYAKLGIGSRDELPILREARSKDQ